MIPAFLQLFRGLPNDRFFFGLLLKIVFASCCHSVVLLSNQEFNTITETSKTLFATVNKNN